MFVEGAVDGGRRSTRIGIWSAALAGALLVGACAITASPSPSRSPETSVEPTTAASPAALAWTGARAEGLDGADLDGLSWVVDGDRLIAAGAIVEMVDEGEDAGTVYYSTPAAWTSTDGRTWSRAEKLCCRTESYVSGGNLARGGPGLVFAAGSYERAAIWTSVDGRAWTESRAPATFNDAEVDLLGATDAGVVAFGRKGSVDPRIWVSGDGRAWRRATDETGVRVAGGISALVPVDGALVAFVSVRDAEGNVTGIEAWRTSGSEHWTRLGELPGGAGGEVTHAALGPRGWLALGSDATGEVRGWTAAVDAVDWALLRDPSISSVHGADLVALDAGYLAVGSRGDPPGTTCGTGEPLSGRTWYTADGHDWQTAPLDPALDDVALQLVTHLGDELVALGTRWLDGETQEPWAWRMPTPTAGFGGPTEPPLAGGCG